MFNMKLMTGLAVAAVLSACATTQQPVQQAGAQKTVTKKVVKKRIVKRAPRRHRALAMKKGTYRCELGRKVQVKKVSADQTRAVLRWKKRNYNMRIVHAPSGALRLEHKSGLTWITVVGKSMLLDTKRGKQLANECRV